MSFVGTGGEKKRIDRLIGRIRSRHATSKFQCPQSVNADDFIVLIIEFSFEPACDRVESKNFTASELPNDDLTAKFSEIRRSERQSPGSIKPVALLQAQKQAAARGKDVNKAEPGAKIYEGFRFVLLRVGNVQVAPNVLHIERSEYLRDLLIFESVLAMFIIEFGLTDFNRIKVCVVNRYFPCFQISDIKNRCPSTSAMVAPVRTDLVDPGTF